MIFWIISLALFFYGTHILLSESELLERLSVFKREESGVSQVISILHEIQETLEAGLLPTQDRWERLKIMPAPWGILTFDSLQSLRSQGGAVLPTLKRLRNFAQEHLIALKDAKAKAAQSLAQAVVCLALVPAFGFALYFLMPGLQNRTWTWIAACATGIILSGIGALWLMAMAENARWGGLKQEQRSWMLASQCAAERFLAMIRAGNPADIAWTRACEILAQDSPELAAKWGYSIWTESQVTNPSTQSAFRVNGTIQAIVSAGDCLRKAIQVSLMEGRPCTERIEAAIYSLRKDIHSQIEREIGLLGTQAMKPLFLCVAPSLLGLLAAGLILGWLENSGGSLLG